MMDDYSTPGCCPLIPAKRLQLPINRHQLMGGCEKNNGIS